MATFNAEQLNIVLNARTKELRDELTKAERRIKGFEAKASKNLSNTSKSFDGLAMAAKRLGPALAAAFTVSAIKGITDHAKEIGNLAAIANTGTTEFQKMAIASKTVGIEQQKLSDILKDMNDRVGDFLQTGGGPMKDFFEKIAPKVGVTAQNFKNLSGPDALQLYVSSLQKANASSQDFTFYMEAIASDSTALVPLLLDNGRALTEIGDAAQKTGRILDESSIKKAAELNLKITALGDELRTNLMAALADMSPLLIGASNLMASFTRTTKNAAEEAARLAKIAIFGPPQKGAVLEGTGREKTGYAGFDGTEAGRTGQPRRMRNFNVPTFSQFVDETIPSVASGRGSVAGFDPVEAAMSRYNAMLDDSTDKTKSLGSASKSTADDAIDAYEKMFDGLESSVASFSQSMESSLSSGFMAMIDGTKTTQDAFRDMARDIIQELYRVLVVQQLVGSFKQGGGGILGAAFSGISGRASGGSVMAGRPVTVGEHGRELFVPSSAGRILSVQQAKAAVGGGGVTVQNNYTFTGGVTEKDIARMLPAIEGQTRRAIVDTIQRGGSIARVFR